MKSYDEKQKHAALTTCLRCGHTFYATCAMAWCADCERAVEKMRHP